MAIFIIISIAALCFANEKKQLVDPKDPSEPVVPGFTDAIGFSRLPELPSLPVLPYKTTQKNEPVRVIIKYGLKISEAHPNGDTRRNIANTIKNAQYILYSNETVAIILDFSDGAKYTYHLSSPKQKTEVSPGVFRVNYSRTFTKMSGNSDCNCLSGKELGIPNLTNLNLRSIYT